jgi:hypothetical protein
MRRALALVAFLYGVSVSAHAFAITVQVLQGQVLINRGQGYRMIDGTTEADPGNTVVVNPGGAAQIVYPNGCTMKVMPQSVTSVSAQPPCPAQQPSSPEPTGDEPAISGTTMIVAGAVVVGGGVAAAILLLQKNKPASP